MWLDVKESSVWTEEIHWPCRERIDRIYSIIYYRIYNCLENLKHTHTEKRAIMISLRSFLFWSKDTFRFCSDVIQAIDESNQFKLYRCGTFHTNATHSALQWSKNLWGNLHQPQRSANPAGLKTSSPLIDLHSSQSLPPFRSTRLSWRRGRDEVWHLSSVQSMITWSLWSH